MLRRGQSTELIGHDIWMMSEIWDAGWRERMASDRLLELTGWDEEWGPFWEATAPPDNCSWDGEHLECGEPAT